jgi:hypothetical protein
MQTRSCSVLEPPRAALESKSRALIGGYTVMTAHRSRDQPRTQALSPEEGLPLPGITQPIANADVPVRELP